MNTDTIIIWAILLIFFIKNMKLIAEYFALSKYCESERVDIILGLASNMLIIGLLGVGGFFNAWRG